MRLTRLMTTISAGADASGALDGADLEIAGLTADSRLVRPGFLFAALPGSHNDGRAFIADAVAKGATAILAPPDTMCVPPGVRLIEDPAPRRAFALMAAAFYSRQPKTVVAVTGTNGKTSTVQFVRQIWERLGKRGACLGTLGLSAPAGVDWAGPSMTTPDPVALHAGLASLAEGGVDHLAMEASSHGLDQFRLDGVRLKAAAFTNLTRDHLDYHGDMVTYLAAKGALFARVLADDGIAVLNADAPEFPELALLCQIRGIRVLGYGFAGRELKVVKVTPLAHGQRLTLLFLNQPVEIELGLIGRFQAWNALCALGLVLAADPQGAVGPVLEAVEALEGVPGRLQLVAHHPAGAPVIVDYAHTPDALETVLNALRPHATGKLALVFGCGGDRDRGKRPVMGEIAIRLADRVIVTDDNPRGEVPAAVRAESLAAAPGAVEIGDRRMAIKAAVGDLAAGDLLVIAGKGHEQGQIVGAETRPFDDAAEVRAAVAEITK